MKNLIVLLSVLALIGCTKEPVNENASDKEQSPSSSAIANNIVSSDVEELTPTEARNFAVNLLKKINDDEQFIRDAYELKEIATLEKYVLNDWNNYVSKPFSPVEEKIGFGHLYFPSSNAMSPYTICDTAFTDLNLYANALYKQLREDTATIRKIVRQEEADYLKSKAKCEERVNLTYDQALAADEAE